MPRLRMDQLMDFGWKILVPACLIWLFVTAGVMLIIPG
jgi:NADH-quinone oxidoreductase subunit H